MYVMCGIFRIMEGPTVNHGLKRGTHKPSLCNTLRGRHLWEHPVVSESFSRNNYINTSETIKSFITVVGSGMKRTHLGLSASVI